MSDVNNEDLRVLVVDDHMLMRNVVYQQLKNVGFVDIEVANDGEQALEKLENEDLFDVVLLDLGMPVMDGMTLLKKCRAKERYAKTAFVVLTGEQEQKSVIEAVQAGATSYIVKPVSQDELCAKLEKAKEWLAKKKKNPDTEAHA